MPSDKPDGPLSSRADPDYSINLSDKDLSSAVHAWVEKRYGSAPGHWRAKHACYGANLIFDWEMIEEPMEKP